MTLHYPRACAKRSGLDDWGTKSPLNTQVIGPAFVAVVVVALTHLFTSRRERKNRQREQRISYLVSVFRSLTKANNHPRLHEVAEDLEASHCRYSTSASLQNAQQLNIGSLKLTIFKARVSMLERMLQRIFRLLRVPAVLASMRNYEDSNLRPLLPKQIRDYFDLPPCTLSLCNSSN